MHKVNTFNTEKKYFFKYRSRPLAECIKTSYLVTKGFPVLQSFSFTSLRFVFKYWNALEQYAVIYHALYTVDTKLIIPITNTVEESLANVYSSKINVKAYVFYEL